MYYFSKLVYTASPLQSKEQRIKTHLKKTISGCNLITYHHKMGECGNFAKAAQDLKPMPTL